MVAAQHSQGDRLAAEPHRQCSRLQNSRRHRPRRRPPPVRSGVVVVVAAAAADVHIPVCVDLRSPVRVHVCVTTVRHVPMEVVAVEISTAVRAGGCALPTTASCACPPPPPPRPRFCTRINPESSGWTAVSIARETLPGVNSATGAAMALPAREHHGGREQDCGSIVHFSAPDTWLEAPRSPRSPEGRFYGRSHAPSHSRTNRYKRTRPAARNGGSPGSRGR